MRLLSLAPLSGDAVERLEALGALEIDPWSDHVPIKLHSATELIERLRNVDVLLAEADHISAEVIEAADLLAIGTCRGDPVNVDLAAATGAGVAVLRAPGRNARAVAELTVALTFALLRDIVAADDDVRAARWVVDGKLAQQRYMGREIRGVTVGIVGFGAVGREAALLFEQLGASVLVSDPYATDVATLSLDDLLSRADVVSLHAAVTPETRGMIGAAQIAAMKPRAFLVNTARFGLVDEEPLLDALRDGRIAAAAFDHFTNEFLPPDHPLLSMPNVILTPHIGGTTRETVENHTTMMADGIDALLRGEAPPSLVNPDVMPLFAKRLGERSL